MTDEQPTDTTPSQEDLSPEAKKKLNPKLAKLAEIRDRANAVIERTEEEEIELIEDALEEDFGNAATATTPADSGAPVTAGELPPVEAYQPADSGASSEEPVSDPATLEPSAPTEGATGGASDASAEDAGAPSADVAVDSGASTAEPQDPAADVAGTPEAPAATDTAGATDPASSGTADGLAVEDPIVSHPGTPQQDAGVVNSTDNAQPSSVTERDALPVDQVPDGEVPVNNGNPASPQTVATADLVGEGSDLTADNSPLPPDAVDAHTDPVAEKLAAAQPQDPSVALASNTEAQTTSDAAPLPADPAAPNTPIREG